MEKYRITVFNSISNKKRRFVVEAFSIREAIKNCSWKINYSSEDIIKIELNK